MMSIVKNSAFVVAALAAIYQFWFKEFVFDVLGVGRAIEPIENFLWTCRRVTHPQFEGCEDLFLDEDDRVLYAACSGSIARSQWNPGMSKYNVSGRRSQGSELLAIYIDEPTSDGHFRVHSVYPKGYEGATGDATLDYVGFDVDVSKKGALEFWFVNHRPPVDAQKKLLDAANIGSNVSIEVFSYAKGARDMHHVKTISDSHIHSANKVALTGTGGFVVSNDHSNKIGFRKELDLILGGGNVVHCPTNQACSTGTSNSLRFPNGLVRGHDGLVYVPHSAAPFIGVYRVAQDGSLKEVTQIRVGMPVDNLSVDLAGDIWVAGIPRMLELMGAVLEPFDKTSPSTILRIRKTGDAYQVDKILEDAQAKVVSGATTTVFDRLSERLFIGGMTERLRDARARRGDISVH